MMPILKVTLAGILMRNLIQPAPKSNRFSGSRFMMPAPNQPLPLVFHDRTFVPSYAGMVPLMSVLSHT